MAEPQRKTLNKDGSISAKDLLGAYLPSSPAPEVKEQVMSDISIDDLMNAGLQNIRKAMIGITSELSMPIVDRNTIMNLKDIMTMLRDLKRDEKDLLSGLTDEQLQGILNK